MMLCAQHLRIFHLFRVAQRESFPQLKILLLISGGASFFEFMRETNARFLTRRWSA
jgi:hypothetical protein